MRLGSSHRHVALRACELRADTSEPRSHRQVRLGSGASPRPARRLHAPALLTFAQGRSTCVGARTLDTESCATPTASTLERPSAMACAQSPHPVAAVGAHPPPARRAFGA